jgi:gas vesicle protein
LGSSSTGSTRDTISSTVDQAKQQAETEGNRLVGAARTRARTAFEHQQHRVADSIGSVAEALHQAADKLNEQNEDVVARYTDTAAQRIEQFADSLRNRNLDDLVGQAEHFARRQPEVFLGAAVATGFLIARFLRTSGGRASQRRSNLNYGGSNTGYGGSYGERGYGSYGGQNRYSQQGSDRGTGYGSASSGYPGSTSSTSPAGTSGVSGTGAGGGSAALASSTSGTAGTGFGSSSVERNTGVLGTPPASPIGGSTSATTKPDDKGLGSTPPRGTNP